MRKFFTCFILLLTAFLLIAQNTTYSHVYATTQGYYTYTINDRKAILTSVNPEISGDIIIPSYFEHYSLLTIGDYAFDDCTQITSVQMPDSITYIGTDAFYNCSALESISLSSAISSVSDRTFMNCINLSSIIIPSSVKYICKYAFYNCSSLSSIILSKNINEIYHYAFDQCHNLTDVWYTGSIADRQNSLSIGNYNDPLTKATWHYNTCEANNHIYTSSCEDKCSNCEWIRSDPAEHTYDHNCDSICNECSYTRAVADHVYDNECDTSCNICQTNRETTGHLYDGALDLTCNICQYIRGIYGDASSDNMIDSRDLVLIRKFMANFDYDTNTSTVEVAGGADTNGDGGIDARDLVLLRQYFANYDYDSGSSSVVLGPQN